MQRVYGEFIINETASENVVSLIKEYETSLGLNEVPKNFVIRKLGIKVNAACDVEINGRTFSISEKEPLEFGYDSIKENSRIQISPRNSCLLSIQILPVSSLPDLL